MNSKELNIINKDDFESFFEVMKKSFPEIERRTYEGQKSLFDNEQYKVLGYKNIYNEVEAFIAYWNFEEFIFIEHFAVDEKLRGNKIGTDILRKFLNKYSKRIILEVELPDDHISVKRVGFYNRMGFNLNNHEYLQPHLQKVMYLLPLKIMSYPEDISNEDFIKMKNKVYKKVYNFEVK